MKGRFVKFFRRFILPERRFGNGLTVNRTFERLDMWFFLTFAIGMLRKFFVFLSFVGLFIVLCNGQNADRHEVEAVLQKRGEAKVLISAEKTDLQRLADIVSLDYRHGDKWLAYVNARQFEALCESGFAFELFEEREPKAADMASDISQMQSWNRYPTYGTYVAMMQDFARRYYSLCSLDTIGTSGNGRLLLCLRLTNDSCDENRKPKFFYSSSIHGDELTGMIMLLRLADSLLSSYRSDEAIRDLLSSVELYICPLANPDGAYAGGDASISAATRYNANHIDLNRNFPDPVMGSHYDGEAYQVETMAFMDYAKKKRFDVSANLHGGAEVCNYPWDFRSSEQGSHADKSWFEENCLRFVNDVRAYSPAYYFTDVSYDGIIEGGDWYTVYGGRQDWHTYFMKCREITIEISSSKAPSGVFLPKYWHYLGKALPSYVANSTKGIKGVVEDSLSGEKLDSVSVEVAGFAGEEALVLSKGNGFYFRTLSAGRYTLTFSKEGYESKTLDLSVQANGTVTCDVLLKKNAVSDIPHVETELQAEMYPNPNNGSFMLRTNTKGQYRILGMTGNVLQIGELQNGENIVETKNLPTGGYILQILSQASCFQSDNRIMIVQ